MVAVFNRLQVLFDISMKNLKMLGKLLRSKYMQHVSVLEHFSTLLTKALSLGFLTCSETLFQRG